MRLRQSLISTWMNCALQAKFQAVLDMPRQQNARATFGTCVHFALEEYNKSLNIDLAKKVFIDVWDNPEKLGVAPDFWPKYMTFGAWRTKGLQLLDGYHEKVRWETREIVASEHNFLVPFGDHEIEGTVDLVEGRKNGKGKRVLRIVDFKTNNAVPSLTSLQLNIQFTTYIYASLQPEFWMGNGDHFPGMPGGELLWERYKDVPRRGIWWHLQTGKEHDAGGRDDEDFMRLYRVAFEIEKAIERDVYVPTISGESCVYCSYTEQCGLSIKDPKSIREEEDSWS